MKVLTTEGLTKLIQLIKSSFISVDDTVTTNTVTLSTVATSGDYNDLSNKPTIVTSTAVDGQWVRKILDIGSSTAKGDYFYTIPSSVIPADGYKYEVMLNLRVYNSNSSNTGSVIVWTDEWAELGTTSGYDQATAGGYGRQACNTFILPVGSSTRQVNYSVINYPVSTVNLVMWGYRRIGTNS